MNSQEDKILYKKSEDTPITSVRITISPLNDIIVPPVSSKLSFTLFIGLISQVSATKLINVHRSKEPLKPYRFSIVFYEDKPLLKFRQLNKPILLKNNERYWFVITFVGMQIHFSLKSRIGTTFGDFNIEEISIRRTSFRELYKNSKVLNEFKLKFITPALLSAKLCLPPRVRVETGFNVYRLFPQPCLWLRSLVLYWNKYAPRELKFRDGYRLCRLGDVLLAETGYNVRPVTVVYVKSGRVIEHRGFVGWVKYRVVEEWFAKRIAPLLKLAELVGVGRSRSIGFGHVVVEYSDS